MTRLLVLALALGLVVLGLALRTDSPDTPPPAPPVEPVAADPEPVPPASNLEPAQEGQLVVMNLAAHPDDEDGATLTYYRHAKNALAYSVIFTRGEGGQNEIGPELYEALGAIRSQETEKAARRLGTQVHFLNFYDFGYSKIADEAFETWGGQDYVTERLVYLIRKLKPDVMFTNHDTVTVGPGRQHGQHQAVGISAYDAFALAADPSYHPEQLEEYGIGLWQPKRLFLRRGFFNPGEDYDVAVPVGDPHEEEGLSYAALAADALQHHASQGMDRFAQMLRGMTTTQFTLLRSATDAPLDSTDLAGHLPPNLTAQPEISYLIDAGRLTPLAEGAFTLDDDIVVPGQRLRLTWDVDALPTQRLRWEFRGPIDTTLYLSETSPATALLRIASDALPSYPKPTYQYERFTNHPPVLYTVFNAANNNLIAAGYLPLEVAPPLHLTTGAEVLRLRSGANRFPIHLETYDPAADNITLTLAVSRDADRTVIVQEQTVLSVPTTGPLADTLSFSLPNDVAAGDYTLTLTGLANPTSTLPKPAHAQAMGRIFDVAIVEGLKVGVVQSYDNTLEQALQELGLAYTLLDEEALSQNAFEDLHTIIVDIRSYLVRQDLRKANDELLAWVAQGGHLLVNYQKTFEWNAQFDDPFDATKKNPPGFAPYPLTLGRARVTREDAPVEVTQPNHLLFNAPNAIAEDVWKGWVQERGLYFPSDYDARYEELLCMNDPGEEPLCSSTLLAPYEQGTYLYTALGWYRQLKNYHPGAYAMFVNLISLPLTDGRATPGTR